MRHVRFVKDSGDHKAGQVKKLDDQAALDAVIAGHAVNHVDPVDEDAPADAQPAEGMTTKSFEAAPENK
jgi:hypothetical protein